MVDDADLGAARRRSCQSLKYARGKDILSLLRTILPNSS